MGLIDRLLRRGNAPEGASLYAAIVARARQPEWYLRGGVADTVHGRFDMLAAVLAVVLLRLETETEEGAAQLAAHLTERFIDDMDAQLRQDGVGDVGVGKRVGRMMGMLGGRLAAYRDGLATGMLDEALCRNLYRAAPPDEGRVAVVASALTDLARALDATPLDALASGRLP